MKIKTDLISGAGNTFHIINEIEQPLEISKQDRKKMTIQICQKNKADGVIFLNRVSSEIYGWNFYNNDGSDAEMCGNATRCVGLFLKKIYRSNKSKWDLETTAGHVLIHSFGKSENQLDLFEIKMTAIQLLKSTHGFFCNTGVPHLVLELPDISNYKDYKEQASQLRSSLDFEFGTNVTYVQKTAQTNHLKAVSFERGVEDFTAACGTGAMAAAFYNLKQYGQSKTNVEMPGGTLMMDVSNLDQPIMVGPAIQLGSFEYEF